MVNLVWICPRVVDVDKHAKLLEFSHYVHNTGVANVGAIFFERHAEDQGFTAMDCEAVADHQLHDLVSHKHSHRVVDASAA